MSSRRRRTRRVVAIGANVVRAVLLLSVVLATGILLVWVTDRPLIDQLGEKIIAGYEEHYKGEVLAALSLIDNSKPREAEKILLDIIESMGEVHRMDRLGRTYANSLWLLQAAYDKLENGKMALEASRAMVEFDPRSLRAWLAYAKALDRNQERNKAIDAFYRAYRIAPYAINTVRPLAVILHYEHRTLEAKKVLQGYLDANRSGNFAVYYASENELLSNEKGSILPLVALTEKKQTIEVSIKKFGITQLGLGFPKTPNVNIRIPSLALITPNGRTAINLDLVRLGLNDMRAVGQNSFVTTGPNPNIYLHLPPELWSLGIKALEAELEFHPLLPPDLLSIMNEAI